MSGQAVVFMCLILTGVWGGFATLLTIAIRRDRRRVQSSPTSSEVTDT